MELELKHLAPYLPYDINVTYIQSLFGGKEIIKHHNQSIDRIFLDYGFVNLHTEPFSKKDPLRNYLLELRPLSDLEKEIEEQFNNYIENNEAANEVVHLFFNSKNINNYELNLLPYESVEYMFKNHYDVFNLIENGLAIDINTLKQQ